MSVARLSGVVLRDSVAKPVYFLVNTIKRAFMSSRPNPLVLRSAAILCVFFRFLVKYPKSGRRDVTNACIRASESSLYS